MGYELHRKLNCLLSLYDRFRCIRFSDDDRPGLFFILFTTSLSVSAIWFSNSFQPIVNLTPLTGVKSLIAIGTPCKGPNGFPSMTSLSVVLLLHVLRHPLLYKKH